MNTDQQNDNIDEVNELSSSSQSLIEQPDMAARPILLEDDGQETSSEGQQEAIEQTRVAAED